MAVQHVAGTEGERGGGGGGVLISPLTAGTEEDVEVCVCV